MMSAKYAEMTINKQLFSICTFLAQRCFCRVIGSGKNDPNYSIPVTPDKTLRIPNISLEKRFITYKKENIFYNMQVVGHLSGGEAM